MFVVAVLVVGAAGGGIYWLQNRPEVYTDDRGFSADFPHGWTMTKDADRTDASGSLESTLYGQGSVTLAPYRDGRATQWPEDGKQCFSVPTDWSQETEIAGSRAVLATFNEGAHRYLGAAIDHGAQILVYRIGCHSEAFEKFRPLFERCARGARFEKR